MEKRYDQRSILCSSCHFFWKAGDRKIMGCTYTFFPDGCTRYGYSFHDIYEPFPSCEGYRTEEQFQMEQKQRELLKKRKKR